MYLLSVCGVTHILATLCRHYYLVYTFCHCVMTEESAVKSVRRVVHLVPVVSVLTKYNSTLINLY